MSCDLKEEAAVAPGVDELVFGRTAQWKPAENERPGVVRYFLSASLSFVAHELDRFEVLEPAFGDA
jgi:hypothetical protein